MEHEPFTEDELDDEVLEMLARRKRRLAQRENGMAQEEESPFTHRLKEFMRRRPDGDGFTGRLPTE